MDERSYENILVYDISLIGAKPLHIRFDKIDRFIRVYNGTRYLVLISPEKYDAIYKNIRYCASQKKVVLYMLFLIIIKKSKLIHMILCL